MTARDMTVPSARAAPAPASTHGLRCDTASVFASQVVGVTTAVAGAVITARVLGPSGRGVLALATLWVSFFALSVPLSAGYGIIYELRHVRATLTLALSSALGLALALGTVGIGLALLSAWSFSRTLLHGVPLGYVALASVGLPAAVFNTLVSLALTGAGRVKQASVLSAVTAVVSLLLVVGALVILRLGVWGAVAASAAASLVGAALTIVWLRAHFELSLLAPRVFWLTIVRFGLKIHGGTMAQWANYYLDRFLINLYLGPVAVGVYAVAAMLAERLWLLPGAVGAALYCRTGGDAQDDAEVSARACRNTLWMMIGAFLLVAAAAPSLVPLVFGRDFAPAGRVLLLFLPGVVLLTAGKVLAPYICNRGRPILATHISLGALAITLALNVLLIPSCGIAGAAIASSVAYGANGIASALVFARMSGRPLRALVSFPHHDVKSLGLRGSRWISVTLLRIAP